MAHTSAIFESFPETSQRLLDDIEKQFQMDTKDLQKLTAHFLREFSQGLAEYNHPMAMIPSFVTGVPDGTETGTFLALDLGGTNLRVCEVELHGNNTFTLRQQKYKVSETLKTGEATVLFDYLADSVDEFLTDYASSSAPQGDLDRIPLGLTFSFPVEQTALDEGKILTWTKGFNAKNSVGKDVVKLLQDAFDRKHLHVKCVALINDTVGALLSRSYTAGKSVLGAIFGTGTNGAYLEDVAKITKLGNSSAVAKGGKMIVNTEWGAFDNARWVLPSTPFDNKLDRESINPHFQAFEKFISGMYLGEITRNILLALIDAAPKPILFSGKSTTALNTHYGLDTAVMSKVEEAWESIQEESVSEEKPGGNVIESTSAEATAKVNGKIVPPTPKVTLRFDPESVQHQMKGPSSLPASFTPQQVAALERIRAVLVEELGFSSPDDVTLRDAAIVRWTCSLVAERAAKLSGCAVAAVLVQTGQARLDGTVPDDAEKTRIGVGVDGSLIQFYPRFQIRVRDALRSLVGAEVEKVVEIGMAKDGSGVGAALCALQAVKQHPDALIQG
ncbi:hypothetical protein NEOLEDRAFT_1177072 [Neolentinus lepideus HHB14362 ss-1]|uniref:Phosphotransferase n=1 Tax=Neolentinus lepideus HHB14362 ss-1 TaxID=1314782 RepID=A0A165TMB0_9AGAM|nr:hypothetical protein NEOLEDRAFT_1177072 [Neolentinus lepideus HHB14362 ss-1]